MKYYWACFECLNHYGLIKYETAWVGDHPFTYNMEDSTLYSWLRSHGLPTLLNWKEITEEEFHMHPEGE